MAKLKAQFLLFFLLSPAHTYVLHSTKLTTTRDDKNFELEPSAGQVDIMDYVHGKTIKHGNFSDSELQLILDSLTQMVHPESPRFHTLKVYAYNFGESKESSEVLVYSDPDEKKQWVVDIEDVDMRQNLIIFRLGDLGFGFKKENTYVVIRKSTFPTNPVHYVNLVHVPSKKLVGVNRVEWDNLRPADFIPVPLKVEESIEDHALHCIPRKCGLVEAIFGTCIIVQLSCDSIKGLPLLGHDKERIDSLIRDKQPFLYEIARRLSTNSNYLKHIQTDNIRSKRDINRNEDSVEIPDLSISPQHPSSIVASKGPPMLTAEGANLNGLDNLLATPDGFLMSSRVSRSDDVPKNDKQLQSATETEKLSDKNDTTEPTEINNTQSGSQQTPLQKLIEQANIQSSYFESLLEKIRNSPPLKYTNRPFECVNCEGMGNFFTEFEESIQTATFVVNILADMFMSAKVADIFNPEAQEMLREHWKVPFVGHGNCPYNPLVIGAPPKSTEVDDIVDFFAETLGLNCDNADCEATRPKTRLRELLTSKQHMLEIYFDMTVRFNKSSQLPKHAILSTHEFEQFMISVIFSSYTLEYRRQLSGQQDEDIFLPNHNQSYRMRFLTRVILRVLNDFVRQFPQHLIKACRLLLQILQDKFAALLVERFGILEFEFQSNSKERKVFIEMNMRDRIEVMALKDFIINGLVPMGTSGTPSEQVFATFFIRNRERIRNTVLMYGLDDDSIYNEQSVDDKLKDYSQEVDLFGQSSIEVKESYDPPISSIEVELEEADTVLGFGGRANQRKQNYIME